MTSMIQSFKTLPADKQSLAGGKGGALARLYQAGYPVPDGFIILPSAFIGDELTAGAWNQISQHLDKMRNGDGRIGFAVRSSALSEDSAQASFAGEFETVLDVRTDTMIKEAIHAVRRSRKSERVQAYSQAKGMEFAHEIAVVVQCLVRADSSGILFTADPVTGSLMKLTGNYIYGLGEALVSGETEPFTFTLTRPKGVYEGPPELKRFAKKLYKMGNRLEKELGCPQDIEWAIANGKLYLLQSRPITTLMTYNPTSGMINASHVGDYLWMGNEVFPDVMTPSTWSLWQSFHAVNIAGMTGMGNIAGRMYFNYSLMYWLMRTFGRSDQDTNEYFELVVGKLPEGMLVPDLPVTKLDLVKAMLPTMWRLLPRQLRLKRRFQEIVSGVPERCHDLRQLIRQAEDKQTLINIWDEQLFPLFDDLLLIQDASNEDYFYPYMSLKKELAKLTGQRETDRLLSTMVGGSGQMASLGPLVGLAKLVKGEMSLSEYAHLVGHRPARENELIEPRPYEDPDWLDKQIAEFEKSPVDVERMIEQRAKAFDSIWREFEAEHPKKAKGIRGKIDKITAAIEKRETIRTELTRTIGVFRDWFLKAGELTGLGDGVFFLLKEELLANLAGDETALDEIESRKEMYEKLSELPPYPMVINGRFDPFQWASDPNRRSDVYDAHAPVTVTDSGAIKGFAGSSGRVEGVVRLLSDPSEGYLLQEGEILLAKTTNVGWTPLFPRAAAVITDIGAPLSHAAIVARELGIPAVVGCGNATMRLESGDRVVVDGGQGIVEILA